MCIRDRMKIVYSENQTADERIKKQIAQSKSPRNIIVVTSDSNISQFAKVCSSNVILSEIFAAEIRKNNFEEDEQSKIKAIDNVDEFKKLFGI